MDSVENPCCQAQRPYHARVSLFGLFWDRLRTPQPRRSSSQWRLQRWHWWRRRLLHRPGQLLRIRQPKTTTKNYWGNVGSILRRCRARGKTDQTDHISLDHIVCKPVLCEAGAISKRAYTTLTPQFGPAPKTVASAVSSGQRVPAPTTAPRWPNGGLS